VQVSVYSFEKVRQFIVTFYTSEKLIGLSK
jgi:hypothetical protein